MTRKHSPGYHHVKSATDRIKACGTHRELYVRVFGKEPTSNELQSFRNRIMPSRSNPPCDLLGLFVEKIPELQGVTLAEFFGIENLPKEDSTS